MDKLTTSQIKAIKDLVGGQVNAYLSVLDDDIPADLRQVLVKQASLWLDIHEKLSATV